MVDGAIGYLHALRDGIRANSTLCASSNLLRLRESAFRSLDRVLPGRCASLEHQRAAGFSIAGTGDVLLDWRVAETVGLRIGTIAVVESGKSPL